MSTTPSGTTPFRAARTAHVALGGSALALALLMGPLAGAQPPGPAAAPPSVNQAPNSQAPTKTMTQPSSPRPTQAPAAAQPPGPPSLHLPVPSPTQPPRQPSSAELLRAIERLQVVGNVLYVAAHPDDENTRLLSYLVGERLLRTAYLSLTRGDGGQNLIGAEQGPLLGLIRTQELLAARRVDGAEQLFTRARDFGYSKTPSETLAIWDKDAVLADVVWAIRRFRPDVVFTRFSPKAGDTHGHHTASAMLAQEAFRLAADPSYHPEQVQQVGTWQAKRIYWNRSLWGGRPSDDLGGLPSLDIGGYNPVLGQSYGEIAADSRSMHKSQGFGAARSRGPLLEYFQPLSSPAGTPASPPASPSPASPSPASGGGPLDGLDFTWARVPGSATLQQLLAQAQRAFDPRRPEAVIPLLLQARAELVRLPDSPFKQPKQRELDEILVAAAGLWVEALAADYALVPGGTLALSVSALNRSGAPLRLKEVRLPDGTVVPVGKALGRGEPWQLEKPVPLRGDVPSTNPYWLAEPPEKGMYTVRDPHHIGLPENAAALSVELLFALGPEGAPLSVSRPVLYKWTDPVAGERYRAVEITPPVLLNPEAQVLMFGDATPKPLRVRVRAGIDQARGSVKLELPAGFVAEPPSAPFQIEKKGGEEEVRFLIRPPASATTTTGSLRAVATLGGDGAAAGAALGRGLHRIDYPHIPIQTVLPEAVVKLCRFDLKKTKARIGYVAGAGDEVAAALRQVGYEVTVLDDEALGQPLVPARYAAIVTGVRAYNTNPRLALHHKRLMDYVAAGGNLVVQYNTNNRLSKLQSAIGPYPFEISQDRVTDENAAVIIDKPAAPLPIFSRPNRITTADFDGWVQERGLYFADKWSDKYEAPLTMQDPGEPARRGSLIVARHGKGAFIYTGLAFFRQLPAGVPGAYRLFANLLSYVP
ncbi:MAG: PIG-L family deacetylase [Polyangia bacterium]